MQIIVREKDYYFDITNRHLTFIYLYRFTFKIVFKIEIGFKIDILGIIHKVRHTKWK